MTDSRSINLSVEVPGTPEEVWEAIATGPGITSWFIPMQITEKAGGDVLMDFGTFGKEKATVVAWEPPRRVVFEGSEMRGRRLAYEWTVEARDSGTCTVRLVNSGFGPEADWDGDYNGMTGGWKIFMQNLRLQLTHFRGQRAVGAVPVTMLPGPNKAAWSRFCSGLGVPEEQQPGDRIATSGEGVPPLSGTIDRVMEQPGTTASLLVLDGPVAGTGFIAVEGDGDQVACSLYLYLYGDGAANLAAQWEEWMARVFPMPAPATQ